MNWISSNYQRFEDKADLDQFLCQPVLTRKTGSSSAHQGISWRLVGLTEKRRAIMKCHMAELGALKCHMAELGALIPLQMPS